MEGRETFSGMPYGRLDSFEANMDKIQQTNELLENIESKLTSFFNRGSALNNQEPMPRESIVSTLLSLKNHDLPKSMTEGVTTGRIQETPPSFQYEVDHINNSRIEIQEPSHIGLRDSVRAYENLANKQSNYESLNSRNTFGGGESNFIAQPQPKQFVLTQSNDIRLLDKMGQLEGFYQNRIRLLEEKLYSTDIEAQNALQTCEKLNQELQANRKTINEFNSSLKQQEERLINDYDGKIASKDNSLEQMRHQSERLAEKYQELNKEYESTFNEKLTLRDKVSSLEEEKDNITNKYQNLMNVHNEMIQLDIQKNMRLSSSQNSSHLLSMRQESRESSKLGRIDQEDSIDTRSLIEALEMYQKELHNLKENNRIIRREFDLELERVKNELNKQKEQNNELFEELHDQKVVNQKLMRMLEEQKMLYKRDDSTIDYTDMLDRFKDYNSQVIQKEMLSDNTRDIGEQLKENINQMNGMVHRISKEVNTSRSQYDLNSSIESTALPFTNPQIKNSLSKAHKQLSRVSYDGKGFENELKRQNDIRPGSAIKSRPDRLGATKLPKKLERNRSLEEFEQEVAKLQSLVKAKRLENEHKKALKNLNDSTLKMNRSSIKSRSSIGSDKDRGKERDRSRSLPKKRLY